MSVIGAEILMSKVNSAKTTMALGLALGLIGSGSIALAETVNYPQTSKTTTSGSSTVVTSKSSSTTAGTTTSSSTTSKSTAASTTSSSDLVALQGPTQLVHNGAGWKENPSYINIKQGQEVLPLTLTVSNGVNGATKVTGLRITLNGRKLANETYFRGSDKFSIDMSGLLSTGDTQMVIQTFGPSGAAISWVLTTGKIKVSDIKPEAGGAGDKMTITGKNLPKQVSAYKLFVGSQPATIKSVTDKQIEFIVPSGLTGDKQTVTLYIAGVKCDPLYFKTKSAPVITGVDMLEAPPSSPITVSGKGFSTKASENTVQVGGATCQITSCSATQITAIIPESIQCPQRDIPVTVKTNGVDAKGNVTMSVTMRTIRGGEGFGFQN
ncbi:MAG: hypothetical protein QG574_1760 [Cyanobacteriota bacterium erpe_2018_sw_21hr_WHONDRS-SW48-000092_B_bin.40]|nr:hypothetical protein [Cyanobacteriota bacterium erpe_2018_sw_21hr_WHONDRS-SW48-000092_B_bin.40]